MATKAKSKKPEAVSKKTTQQEKSSLQTGFLTPERKQQVLKVVKTRQFLVIALVLGLSLIAIGASKLLIVAWVDNKPITRIEFYSVLEKKFGKDTKEQLIVEKLVENEAKKRNIVVTPDQVQVEIKKLEESQGGADKLNQVLTAQGITREDLNKAYFLRLVREAMFTKEASISTKEVDDYLETNKEMFVNPEDGTQTEITDAIKKEVRDQLREQKINGLFSQWMNGALSSSRVVRF